MAKRSERLLALMQALRRRRRPVAGQVLAEEMGISLRSLYRDIETLKSMGAAIDGEAGLGFALNAEHFLPPLMFSQEEIEALVLGLRTLVYGPDADMARTARDAVAKINAVLPEGRRGEMESVGLFVVPSGPLEGTNSKLSDLRRALREERQVQLEYRDQSGVVSSRVIYPLALGYYDDGQVLIAWCSLRQGYRRFRLERMIGAGVLDAVLPRPRRTLLYEWRKAHNLPDLS